MVRGPDIVYLEPDKLYDMSVNWEPYTAQMVDPDALNISRASIEERYMMLVGDEPDDITARTFATVHLVLDEASDVLFVPSEAVKKANARTFVYVLTDGIRTIRDVQIGLEGNNGTEIVSGLYEGEQIFQE
jgi:regulatory protein YycH of two-component signal transduction system YycFG